MPPASIGNRRSIASLQSTCAPPQRSRPRSTSPPHPTIHFRVSSHFREERLHRHDVPLLLAGQCVRVQHTGNLLPRDGGRPRAPHVQNAHDARIVVAYDQLVGFCCIHQQGCDCIVRRVQCGPARGVATVLAAIDGGHPTVARGKDVVVVCGVCV